MQLKLSKRGRKYKKTSFSAPGRGPSVNLTPATDRASKNTIENTLIISEWRHLAAVLTNMPIDHYQEVPFLHLVDGHEKTDF